MTENTPQESDRDQREREARALAFVCDRMGLSVNRVLVIAAGTMAKANPSAAIEMLRTLADSIELMHAPTEGQPN